MVIQSISKTLRKNIIARTSMEIEAKKIMKKQYFQGSIYFFVTPQPPALEKSHRRRPSAGYRRRPLRRLVASRAAFPDGLEGKGVSDVLAGVQISLPFLLFASLSYYSDYLYLLGFLCVVFLLAIISARGP